jgi:hypothetical protein
MYGEGLAETRLILFLSLRFQKEEANPEDDDHEVDEDEVDEEVAGTMGTRCLDEVIRYINGSEDDKDKNGDKGLSAKAANSDWTNTELYDQSAVMNQ